ncbi:hypothetical protein HPB50_015040 [Hyalomma asiaticum]|uniref:Uncharacterized protein n=1 Tax=Hyalomma asiaticum TaxID=266040 RepID=A0ACB7RR69_HYAAI|nr:hypothetical protein HPB50_015040 [Hyalomma asiaticum]
MNYVVAAFGVSNLSLLAVDNHYITLAWDQPQGYFDFYTIGVRNGNDKQDSDHQRYQARSCGNGTIIHREQTRVICGPFNACSSVSVTLRTFIKGQPEQTSSGNTLKDIFISGKGPSEPRSITTITESPHTIELAWAPPASVDGILDAYYVKVCENSTCDEQRNSTDCVDHEVSSTRLVFNSTVDTPYCILISARARCGGSILIGPPAAHDIRTASFTLSDVSNLTVAGIRSGYVTLTWQKPSGRFDYYTVEVTGGMFSSETVAHRRHGWCSNGTIIRPDQTELTCGPFDPCTKLSCTVRTHFKGPQERSSPGVTVSDIFVPAEDLNPPTNITMIPETPSQARLRWSAPAKSYRNIESYSVKICSPYASCHPAEMLGNCVEHVTTETRTVFDSQVDTSYCVLISAKIRCGTEDITSPPGTSEIRTPLLDLPDVTNFRLLSALNGTITVEWKKPKVRFDYYRLYIAADKQDNNGDVDIAGTCGNGTILHPNQTKVTCTNLETCTNVSFTLHTHRNGPPEHTSHGVSLENIFVPGEEPDPPMNISIHGQSPSHTRLQWEPVAKFSGRFLEYSVKICTTFKSCVLQSDVDGCSEVSTYDTWLDFRSSVDTAYCVFVTTHSQCGEQVLHGRPAVTKIRTPLLALPEVTNLKLVSAAKQYVTIAWDQPKGRFDFYWLDIADGTANKSKSPTPGSVQGYTGSCGNGTIIRAEQTKITCGPFKACSTIAATIHTYVKGPPELISLGTALNDIFMRGQEPSEPSSITVLDISPSITRVQWEAPTNVHGILDVYTVKVCDKFMTCDKKQNVSGCTEHTTLDTRLDFASTADTSYCVVVTASARCGVEILTSQPATMNMRTPLFDIPDVTNFRLLSAVNRAITVEWKKPKIPFDYYRLYITADNQDYNDNVDIAGTCGNGTILHPNQTRVTCTNLETCTNVSLTLHTHRNGPPEHTSHGVSLENIFIPAEALPEVANLKLVSATKQHVTIAWDQPKGRFDFYWLDITDATANKKPSEPSSITVIDISPSITRVQWEAPTNVHGILDVYTVKVCDKFMTCHKKQNRPQGRFDYYSIEVIEERVGGRKADRQKLGACANGTIVHRDQTQLTCGPFEPCAKLTYTLHTHLNGPPDRASPGVTVKDVFIPAEHIDPPRNITLVPESPLLARLYWDHPEKVSGNIDSYYVTICSKFKTCPQAKSMSDCTERVTSVMWTTFNSSANTAYCVMVMASRRCGRNETISKAAIAEVRTPVLAPPAVKKLRLGPVGADTFVLAWQRPRACFDYYTVEAIDEDTDSNKAVTCNNGTEIDASKASVTCDQLDTCAVVKLRVTPHTRGRPEGASATLRRVHMPGKAPAAVTNLKLEITAGDRLLFNFQARGECQDDFVIKIYDSENGTMEVPNEYYPSKPGGITMVPKSPYTTQIQWEPPPSLDGTIDVYKVTVCEKSTTCGDREKLTGCVEHEVSETWLDFGSTADTTYCVLVSASSRCGVNVLIGPPAVQEITTPLFELPDVNNLNLVAVDNNYITVAWDQPRDSFDFYWLDVTDGDGNKNGSSGKLRVGTCGNGTIIRPEQTQISCGPFDACSSVSITVPTYSKGPPELVSTGTTLNDIFIGGKEPSEPRSLTMLAESPSTTRFQWERPASLQGTFHGYKVQDTLDGCVEYETSDSWIDVDTTPDTQYCVVVTAAVRCGRNVLYSAPVTRGVKTPLFALPDVSNLSVAVVKSGYVTLSWQRPRGRFDHYTVEVIEHAVSIASASQKRHGSCASVIIRPDQTELTCGPFEPCTNLSGTIRTHVNGPPDHSSPGASVIGIFIPLEDPSPPTNITMTAESASRTLLQWSPPEENSVVIESYSLKICKTIGQCEKAETLSDCADYVTKETRAVFDSKEDSSYCVLIRATTRCGTEQISSRQATLEIRTPIFDLPSVTNFRLLSAANNPYRAWERPEVRFDFYWVSISRKTKLPMAVTQVA